MRFFAKGRGFGGKWRDVCDNSVRLVDPKKLGRLFRPAQFRGNDGVESSNRLGCLVANGRLVPQLN